MTSTRVRQRRLPSCDPYDLKMPNKPSHTLWLCSLANFINAADRAIMPIAIVPMTDEFKWDLHGQGWVLSSFAVGYMSSQEHSDLPHPPESCVGATLTTHAMYLCVVVAGVVVAATHASCQWAVIGGALTKKYGGKNVLMISVLLWSMSTFCVPLFADSIYALTLARVILGLGEGLGLPTIFHIFSHGIPCEERSRSFGYLVAFGSFGQMFASVICPHLSWRLMFYSFGSIGFLWVFVWMYVYKETRGCIDEEFVDPPKVNNNNVDWREFISHWPLWSIYIAHFSMNWSNYIIMHWLPTYLTRSLGAGKGQIMLIAVPYCMNSLVGVVAGHCADSLITKHKWTVLSVRRLMTSIGLLGPGLFILFFSAVNNLPLAVLFVTISLGLSACNSSGHLSNHAEVAPNYAGITFAISNTLATIPGITCGPLTAELVTQSHGRWFPVFVLAACVNFVGAVVYLSQSAASQLL